MSGQQLIPFFQDQIGGEDVNTVNARELHSFLEVGKDFSNWIKDRIEAFKFEEAIDFIKFAKFGESKSRQLIEYHLTLDMAKELAMLERNQKGKEIRNYFIAAEKELKIKLEEDTKPEKLVFNSSQTLKLIAEARKGSPYAQAFLDGMVEVQPDLSQLDEVSAKVDRRNKKFAQIKRWWLVKVNSNLGSTKDLPRELCSVVYAEYVEFCSREIELYTIGEFLAAVREISPSIRFSRHKLVEQRSLIFAKQQVLEEECFSLV